MSLVELYGWSLAAIFVVSFSVGWMRQRTLIILLIVLWLATLSTQIIIPGYTPPWLFGLLQFPFAVVMFKTARGNKWHLAVASWFIPMMLAHAVFSLIQPVIGSDGKAFIPDEVRYNYYYALNFLSFAQLATFGLWLVLDYGHYITDPIARYFSRRSREHVLPRKQK